MPRSGLKLVSKRDDSLPLSLYIFNHYRNFYIDLSNFAYNNNLQALFKELITYLARRISLSTIATISAVFKDWSIERGQIVQNGFRAAKKWIAINFEYF